MTALSTVREALATIADLPDSCADESAVMARDALALLDRHLERQRQSPSRLLSGVDETCITRCERVGDGAFEMRARLGVIEVAEFNFGNPETETNATILAKVKADILDSLRVEIVRDRVAEASDCDLLDALDAAERGGDTEVGEILAAAHDRSLRLLS